MKHFCTAKAVRVQVGPPGRPKIHHFSREESSFSIEEWLLISMSKMHLSPGLAYYIIELTLFQSKINILQWDSMGHEAILQ